MNAAVPPDLKTADAAFGFALMKERPQLLRMTKLMAKDAERAEDLASEAILRAWRHRASFETGTNLLGWLVVIARNLFLTEQRRKKWDGGSIEDIANLTIAAPASQDDHMALRDIERAMALLPRDQVAALMAVVLDGDYEDAAHALNETVGTIKSRVARGRAALQQLLA